jgi:hypothetical protein
MIDIFATSTMLTLSKTLPKERKYNENYFIFSVLPWLIKEKRRFARKNLGAAFLLQMDTSACRNGQKITGYLTSANIARAPHLPYSSDLSPCDFWLFGFLKESMESM